MSYGINAYQSAGLHGYGRVPATPEAGSAQAPEQATRPEPTAAAERTAGPAALQDLSAAERDTIQRYFPERPELSMRLYGPDQHARTVRPDALGRRLDVSG